VGLGGTASPLASIWQRQPVAVALVSDVAPQGAIVVQFRSNRACGRTRNPEAPCASQVAIARFGKERFVPCSLCGARPSNARARSGHHCSRISSPGRLDAGTISPFSCSRTNTTSEAPDKGWARRCRNGTAGTVIREAAVRRDRGARRKCLESPLS
jgi:hypothetical protein